MQEVKIQIRYRDKKRGVFSKTHAHASKANLAHKNTRNPLFGNFRVQWFYIPETKKYK